MRIARVRTAAGETLTVRVGEDFLTVVGPGDRNTFLQALRSAPSDGDRLAEADVRYLAPVDDPPSVRDFMVFEEHVANARTRTGRDVPEEWYAQPAFYFSNPAGLIGPETDVRRPRGSRALDYELEIACVIGREVSDLDAADPAALEAIAGFMLMNDWSARDLQMGEMKVGLGPAKGKDFATSTGPWAVTPDELGAPVDGRWSVRLDAYVNGRHVGGADAATARFGWHEIVARASRNTTLRPGDVIGSGTVGTGCLLELRELGHREENPWLKDGDVVELRGGPLGILRNRIAPTES